MACESYALTLWTFLQFGDVDRIAGILAKSDRLDLAALVRIAVLSDTGLADAQRVFEAAHLRPAVGPAITADEAMARFAVLQEAIAGRNWSSTPPPTMH